MEHAVRLLRESGIDPEMAATDGPGSAGEIARDSVRRGADLILVAGGDGTLNEALNGMIHSEVPLAFLPGGTANVLATEMGIGTLEEAARTVSKWTPRRLAAGLLRSDGGATERYFLLLAGAGLDAQIVKRVDPAWKKQSGKLSYWLAGFGELGRRLEEFDVRVEDQTFRCSFALASRVRDYGGTVALARGASLFRDDFEVVLFEGSSSLQYLKYLAGALTDSHYSMKGVRSLRARKVEFSAPPEPPLYVQVDGEPAGRLPASVEIVPDAVTLLAPPHFRG